MTSSTYRPTRLYMIYIGDTCIVDRFDSDAAAIMYGINKLSKRAEPVHVEVSRIIEFTILNEITVEHKYISLFYTDYEQHEEKTWNHRRHLTRWAFDYVDLNSGSTMTAEEVASMTGWPLVTILTRCRGGQYTTARNIGGTWIIARHEAEIERSYLNVRQVSALVGLTPEAVKYWIRKGGLKATKKFNTYYCKKIDIELWLAGRPEYVGKEVPIL